MKLLELYKKSLLKESTSSDLKDLKVKLGLRHIPDQFSNKEAAIRWADKAEKMHVVMIGDNGKFWVVVLSDASRLMKAGYKRAQ